MITFDSISTAADAARRFFLKNEDSLPQHVQDKVEPRTRQGESPVDLIADFTEAVYANRDSISNEGLEIAAGCANLIGQDGYHGRLDGRASSISFALRRDSGEKAGAGRAWPKKADDPAPKAEFAKPAEDAAPTPTADKA